jgi:syntaxin 1B/2/3
MNNSDFLSRVDGVRKQITSLTGQVSAIAAAHQRAISSPDGSASANVENLVSQTQALNTQIKDQIKYLETDAARSGGNATKDSQIRNLKTQFTNQLQEYRNEEEQYKRRYQEQIVRQYRIVNPEATEDEVREASEANWGDEGVFQTAVCLPFVPPFPSILTNRLAKIQPLRCRNLRPRRCPRPPQRHPKDRADDAAAKPTL